MSCLVEGGECNRRMLLGQRRRVGIERVAWLKEERDHLVSCLVEGGESEVNELLGGRRRVRIE